MDFQRYDKLRNELYNVKCFCLERGLPVPSQVLNLIQLIDLYRCDSLCGYYDESFDDEKKLIAYLYGISTNGTIMS